MKYGHRVLSMLLLAFMVPGCQLMGPGREHPGTVGDRAVSALNALRDETNSLYGYRDGVPRDNLGPCGRYANIFREKWNQTFDKQVKIAFVMSADGSTCHHVLIKLPDGRYFDGGNGVISEMALLRIYPQSRVEDMVEFNLGLLDQ